MAPECRQSRGKLKLPPLFANQEWKIFLCAQFERRVERFVQPIQSRDCTSIPDDSAEPIFDWRELFQPGARRGEDQPATRVDEIRGSLEEPPRLLKTTNQIGRQNDV